MLLGLLQGSRALFKYTLSGCYIRENVQLLVNTQSKSHGSNSMHLGMKTRRRRCAGVQCEHHKGVIYYCWCQTGCWSEYFTNCWLNRIFTHNHLKDLKRMAKKKKNLQRAAVVRKKMAWWGQRSGVMMRGLVRDQNGNRRWNNHRLQPRYTEQHHWLHNTTPPTFKALTSHFISYPVPVNSTVHVEWKKIAHEFS